MTASVTVGVDGFEQSLLAVDWAADEAVRRGLPLRIVHVLVPWPIDPPAGAAGEVREWMQKTGQKVVDDAVARAAARIPGHELSGVMVAGQPAPTLLREAEDARLVVLGGNGLGAFAGLLLGSVGFQVAAHATCPVAVVWQPPEQPRGEIVVGVDGSENSLAAVAFAFEEASLRGARLHAIHTWTHPVSTGAGDMLPVVYDVDEVTEEKQRALAESLAGHREIYPDVEVVQRLVRGHPVAALAEASAGADLVVVGSRGRGGFTGLLLGSVRHGVLHHAACPVAIVRPTRGR